MNEIHGLATIHEHEEFVPGRRQAISQLEAQTRRYQMAIIDGLTTDYASFGGLRRILTPNHGIIIRLEANEAAAVI